MNIPTPSSFHLRGFRPQGTAEAGSFTATLMMDRHVVAELKGCVDTRPATAGAGGREVRELEVTPLLPHFWSEFHALHGQDEEETIRAVMEMADAAYHARRLQVMSLRHTAFRLKGDAPGRFRYLRGQPYSAEMEGRLRMTFGRRIETIYRRDPGLTH